MELKLTVSLKPNQMLNQIMKGVFNVLNKKHSKGGPERAKNPLTCKYGDVLTSEEATQRIRVKEL